MLQPLPVPSPYPFSAPFRPSPPCSRSHQTRSSLPGPSSESYQSPPAAFLQLPYSWLNQKQFQPGKEFLVGRKRVGQNRRKTAQGWRPQEGGVRRKDGRPGDCDLVSQQDEPVDGFPQTGKTAQKQNRTKNVLSTVKQDRP